MKVSADLARAIIDGDADGYSLAEVSPWEIEDKYQNREYIIQHEGKFYSISDTRSGSPFTDYYYESTGWRGEVELVEVEQREKVVKFWVKVKK